MTLQGEPINAISYNFIDNNIAKKFSLSELIEVGNNGKYGFVNVLGQPIIRLHYTFLDYFDSGIVAVSYDNQKYGYIDLKENIVIPLVYDRILAFHNELAIAYKNQKAGMIDKKNRVVIDFNYDELGNVYNNQIPANKNGKWGIIDIKQKLIVPFLYDEPFYLTDKMNVIIQK